MALPTGGISQAESVREFPGPGGVRPDFTSRPERPGRCRCVASVSRCASGARGQCRPREVGKIVRRGPLRDRP